MAMLSTFLSAFALNASVMHSGTALADDQIQHLSQAWASGNARHALSTFEAAFELEAEGPCAISPYAAGLAYRVGLLDASGYHFNIALRIDARVGGLTAVQREVAQSMKTEPGERVSEDRLFLFSPYAHNPDELGVCTDRGFPDLPQAQTGQGVEAIIYVRAFWSGSSRGRELREVVLLDAYPPVEGEALANQMIGYRFGLEGRGWLVNRYAFTPCFRTSSRRRIFEVCRQGFEAFATQTD
ncbi:hypothetical protein [Oceanicaulis sp. LC35]|uniref:hypothetical protein n=1 Tax=Oceanicaulis sp. LC35 TaxID=3349635 RepID=UPI003F84FEF9